MCVDDDKASYFQSIQQRRQEKEREKEREQSYLHVMCSIVCNDFPIDQVVPSHIKGVGGFSNAAGLKHQTHDCFSLKKENDALPHSSTEDEKYKTKESWSTGDEKERTAPFGNFRPMIHWRYAQNFDIESLTFWRHFAIIQQQQLVILLPIKVCLERLNGWIHLRATKRFRFSCFFNERIQMKGKLPHVREKSWRITDYKGGSLWIDMKNHHLINQFQNLKHTKKKEWRTRRSFIRISDPFRIIPPSFVRLSKRNEYTAVASRIRTVVSCNERGSSVSPSNYKRHSEPLGSAFKYFWEWQEKQNSFLFSNISRTQRPGLSFFFHTKNKIKLFGV